MSTISPMTPRPQPAAPGEQPVVSLQQRVADRLAQAPHEAQAGGRKKKERAGEEALALHAAVAQTVRDHAQDTAASRPGGAAAIAPGPGQHDARFASPGEAGSPRAPAGAEGQQPMMEPQAARPVAVDESVAHVEASPSIRADTTELPTTGPVSPVRSEAAATATIAAPAEATQLAPRWASATPAPVAPEPSGKEGSSVTVAFQSWGPGHEVRAQWLPGGGVLVPGSERVGQALSAAASQPEAAIAGDGWRVERTDPDAEQRERPRGDAEQDA